MTKTKRVLAHNAVCEGKIEKKIDAKMNLHTFYIPKLPLQNHYLCLHSITRKNEMIPFYEEIITVGEAKTISEIILLGGKV